MNDHDRERRRTAVMCFSSGTGGMEITPVRLANLLAGLAEVYMFCKQGSVTETLAAEGDNRFVAVPVRFSSRLFSPSMLVSVRRNIVRHRIRNVVFLGASELKTLFFAFLGLDINLVVWHGTTKSRPNMTCFTGSCTPVFNTHVAISRHLLRNVKTIVPSSDTAGFKLVLPSVSVNPGSIVPQTRGEDTRIRIVHVGRVAQGKGQIDAVIACEVLARNGIDFRLNSSAVAKAVATWVN